MEITSKNNLVNIDAYVNQVQQQNRAARGDQAGNAGPKGDTVEISDSAKRIQEAKAELERIPEAREDRVAELKNQIESGTYAVNAEKVADKMIKESLFNDWE
jgi:negative regulator of flagellin synthesis FlgM